MLARRAPRVVLGALALLLLAFLVSSVCFRDVLWWWGPDRVTVHGRHYDRGQSVTRAEMDRTAGGPLRVAGHLPLGQPLETNGLLGLTSTTPTVVYLHEWDGTWVAYSLSGGP